MVTRFRSVGRVLLAAGLATALAGCNFQQLKAKRAFNQGNEAYGAKQYRDAIDSYKSVLAALPEDDVAQDEALSSVWFFLGNSYDNLYKPANDDPENQRLAEEAVRNYEIASKRAADPRYRKLALQWLFELYGPDKMDRPDEATQIGTSLIANDPDDHTLYLGLARHYVSIGDPESAIATLNEGLKQNPNEVSLIRQLATTYNEQGEFDSAIEQLERVADLQPEDPTARLRLAQFFQEKVQKDTTLSVSQRREYIERGIEAADTALKVNPEYLEAFVYKRILLLAQAKGEKDRKQYDAIMKQVDAVSERIEALQAQGQA